MNIQSTMIGDSEMRDEAMAWIIELADIEIKKIKRSHKRNAELMDSKMIEIEGRIAFLQSKLSDV